MAKRSKEEWQLLIAEHDKSGLTAAAFCRERGVDSKYFSLRKKQFSKTKRSPFVAMHLASPVSDTIRVDWQGVQVVLPAMLSPLWVANFIKQLSI